LVVPVNGSEADVAPEQTLGLAPNVMVGSGLMVAAVV